jgi:hypothetical protein
MGKGACQVGFDRCCRESVYLLLLHFLSNNGRGVNRFSINEQIVSKIACGWL